MRYLLDTHCWLWLQSEPERLSALLDRLADPANELLLSAASSWEISIKYALGKLPLPLPPAEYVPSRMQSSGTSSLPVHHAHALQVSKLPRHHGDPFDRLLISQAQCEGLQIVTADAAFSAYDVELLRP
ncbi:type II toxin-antitoxin system VapC family toxin [Pendulispora brunnea]|uniref:Type II toxin-antitoxin system VapC family toxin n=1 Tax=Pendulispora brunnea TaxID=2905690 RepID=A0ABZ2K8N5_9BACT